jgi:periplasmic divalent cation tolerance protein
MFRIIETTTDDIQIANSISQYIVKNKLSPCVQIIRPAKSTYVWEGEIKSVDEYTLKIKTVSKHAYEVSSIIKDKSNYDVPEIISYRFSIENDEYEEWFLENV